MSSEIEINLAEKLQEQLALPVIGAPMFLVSGPELVIAQCNAGIIGSFPALNARPKEALEQWIIQIEDKLAASSAAHTHRRIGPFGVNLNVHPTNARLAHDLEVCVRHRVPLLITSLQAPTEVVKAARTYGGLVFHDVTTVRHAEKAAEVGVNGLILVCAGAGGHGGLLSPFALIQEVRRFFSGIIILGGSITNGRSVLAAQVLGADFAYIGTRFIATRESNATTEYKQMILNSTAKDITYTSAFSGLPANYLTESIIAAGLSPKHLSPRSPSYKPAGSDLNINVPSSTEPEVSAFSSDKPKAWHDVWSAGHGVGDIHDVPPVAEYVARLEAEYRVALGKASIICKRMEPCDVSADQASFRSIASTSGRASRPSSNPPPSSSSARSEQEATAEPTPR